MKKLITILMFLFLVLSASGQVFKFKTTGAVLVDKSYNVTEIKGTGYHTFDFTNKMITLKTIDGNGTNTFHFKIISATKSENGVYSMKVTSTDLPGMTSVSFAPTLPYLSYTGDKGEILHVITEIIK